MKQTPETIVLLNFVCEDIQKIARAIRDKHIYTMVMPYTVSVERLMQEKPAGLIICTDAGAPEHGEELKKFTALGLPVMKIMNSRNPASRTISAIPDMEDTFLFLSSCFFSRFIAIPLAHICTPSVVEI